MGKVGRDGITGFIECIGTWRAGELEEASTRFAAKDNEGRKGVTDTARH